MLTQQQNNISQKPATYQSRNKRIPQLRFKEFDGEWLIVTLLELSNNISYGMNSAAIKYDGKHKYLRITDIDEETGTFKPRPLTSPDGEINEKFKLKKNDIVFARTGASVGKPYLYNESDGNLYYAGFLIKFSIKKGNSYFIYSLTQKETYNRWVHVYSMRSGQPGLNAEEYKSLKLTIPTLPEQQKIASFLSAVDTKIQQLSKKKELLEQYKKGVMQQLFSGELRFKDENGKDYPDWEEKRLGEIADRVNRKNKENNLNVLTISAQLGLVSQLEYFNKSVSAKNVTNYFLLKKNEFAYNKSYSTGYPMGAIKRLKKYNKGVVSTLYICFGFKDTVSLSFMEQYFEFGKQNIELEKVAQEGARNHGLLNIGVSDFFNIDLYIPTIPEQQKIATYLTSIDTKIEQINNQLDQTQLFKKGLLQQMFV